MQVELARFVQDVGSQSVRASNATVARIADDMLVRLNEPATHSAIVSANQPGNSSSLVQDAILSGAEELGFQSEKKGLFANYETSGLRPDYYLPLDGSGVLLEVERGKTTTNNMDLLDFWKCHLCAHANHLFLMIPRELRHNPTMTPKREFATVTSRLRSFFTPENYTNVWSLHLFGY